MRRRRSARSRGSLRFARSCTRRRGAAPAARRRRPERASRSDLDVLLDVPAGPLGAAAVRAVLDLDPAEVERDQLGRRLMACFLVERGHEHLAELDLEVLQRLLARATDAQGRLLEVLPAHGREEELRRGLVREHREVEGLEARPARAAAATAPGAGLDVHAPAEGDELDLALVLGIGALALDAVDLEEVVHAPPFLDSPSERRKPRGNLSRSASAPWRG